MSLRKKLLILAIVPVLLSAGVAIIIAAIRINSVGHDGLIAKSTAILTRMEAVRQYIARNGALENTIREMALKYPDGKIPETEKEIIKKQVPIMASWSVGMTDAASDNYVFRIASENPRNLEYQADEMEKEFLNKFKNGEANTLTYFNKKTNELWLMRPIHLRNADGCLKCHGHPSTSPYNNGLDILGYPMEDWTDGELHGMFMIKSDLKPVQQTVRRAILWISFWGFLIGATSIITGLFITGKIINVFNQVRLVSEKIAAGDLRNNITINSNDELGEMAGNINKMIDSLHQILYNVKATATNLAGAVDEITSSSLQISQGAQLQASTYEELSGSIQNTADNSQVANTITQKSVREAQLVGNDMMLLNKSMDEIKTGALRIHETVRLISEIAFQTNILSLNAAVEAARAGEHGRGFSVVATEVKKLAQKSAESASNVARILNENVEQVKNGVKISQNTSLQISAIIEGIQQTASEIDSITQATHEQASAMSKTTTVTMANAAAAEQLAASATALKDQADYLNSIVENFELKKI